MLKKKKKHLLRCIIFKNIVGIRRNFQKCIKCLILGVMRILGYSSHNIIITACLKTTEYQNYIFKYFIELTKIIICGIKLCLNYVDLPCCT